MRLHVFLLAVLLTLPAFSSGDSVVQPAEASTQCAGEIDTILWNTTTQRHALVPFSYGSSMYFEPEPWEDDEDQRKQSASSQGGDYDETLHPEESWMYSPVWPLPTLEPLRTNHYTTMAVGNDSAGALRFNLSSTHRTTFCVNLYTQTDNQTQPQEADVYLLTSQQYERYQEVYRMMHGGWWWQDLDLAGGDANLLSDIPPEWRSFNPLGWQTYRDVHQYEQRSEVTFSLSLDGPEVYTSLFDSDEWEDFYLVVDTWDNTNDADAVEPDAVVYADVTVIAEQRSVLFPPWTVPLFLFGLMLGGLLAPVLLNKRYMEAGIQSTPEGLTSPSVPVLEQESKMGSVNAPEEE